MAIKTVKDPKVKESEVTTPLLATVDEAPILYVDSLIHLSIGPFISKATFGSQGPSGKAMKAALTLVLPTNALLGLSQNIMKSLAPEPVGDKLSTQYVAFNEEISKIKIS